jgi:Domain of unknown function (DUF397)
VNNTTATIAAACWRKSSYSAQQGDCVEVAITADLMGFRDSKNPDGPPVIVSAKRGRTFIAAVRASKFERRP